MRNVEELSAEVVDAAFHPLDFGAPMLKAYGASLTTITISRLRVNRESVSREAAKNAKE